MFLSTNLYANTISIQPFLSNNDVSITHLESQRTTIQNWANGNVEGGSQNIKAGSITSSDLATAINPVTFRNEAFNDWTFSGMLAPTSASLSSTITAGVSYINGVRVQTEDTAHTYTASKDTYTYINAGGFFEYQEVANGASAPSTPANDLLLFKAVTSGSAITSVVDLRTTSIAITANSSNFALDYRNQAVVSLDSATAMHVEPGQFAIGSVAYTNVSDTSSKSTGTLGNWVEGSVPTLNNLKFYVYGYNNSGSTFDFKYASADPVYSDTSLNTTGTLQYYVTGGTTYRALAWISADPTGAISSRNYSNFPSATTTNMVSVISGDVHTCTTAIPNDNTIPTSIEGDQVLPATIRPSNANSRIRIDINVIASGNNERVGVTLFRDGGTSAIAASSATLASDGTGVMPLTYFQTANTTNAITYKVRLGSATPNAVLNGTSGGRIYGGAMASSITLTEVLD